MKYKIQCRYEYRSADGLKWTNWYDYIIGLYAEDEADRKLDELNEELKSSKTGQKTEYRIQKAAI
jgi:CRISPR/Cas system-associated protein Cas7 (RAMP superfamily)